MNCYARGPLKFFTGSIDLPPLKKKCKQEEIGGVKKNIYINNDEIV